MTIPHHNVTIVVGCAVLTDQALALASVEIPEVVVRTGTLDTNALSGKSVKLFLLVITVS